MKTLKIYENENLQKHIILVNLGLREYQNRIQHVHKSAHAKYELCSCPERRVMTILRPPGAKIPEKICFVAARSGQGLPGAARGCQERRVMTRKVGTCESKVACKFLDFL